MVSNAAVAKKSYNNKKNVVQNYCKAGERQRKKDEISKCLQNDNDHFKIVSQQGKLLVVSAGSLSATFLFAFFLFLFGFTMICSGFDAARLFRKKKKMFSRENVCPFCNYC